MSSPRALITGSTGFVGGHLRAELVSAGYEVYGIGTRESADTNYYQVDITDEAAARAAVAACAPTHIFHLAGVSSLLASEQDPVMAMRVNADGAEHILRSALQVDPPPKVLLVSTVHVYGEPEYLPIDEQHPLRGTGAYAQSRMAQEIVGQRYMPQLPIVIARSFNHTGPEQTDHFVISKIMHQIAEIAQGTREDLELGNIDIRRDLSDVRDVVRIYRLLLEQSKMGIITNVCRGSSVSLKEVIEAGKKIAGLAHVAVRVNPTLIRVNDVPDLYGDIKFLNSLIHYTPRFSLEETLREVYQYWQAKL